jgi:hypothetical protein
METLTKPTENFAKPRQTGEPTKEQIVQFLRKKNITDLDGFIDHSLSTFKKSQAVPLTKLFPKLGEMTMEDLIVELQFGNEAKKNAKNNTYQEPKLPFKLNDKTYKPAEISNFNGKLLHYVWDDKAVDSGFLKAVDSPEEMRDFFAHSSDASSSANASSSAVVESHVGGVSHRFYEHINYGGNSVSLGYRHAFPNLTEVTMSGWWFWAVSWNDQISSLRTGSGPVLLGANVMNPYLTGATMTIGANANISWIGAAWNDRVSAILG